ncbi:MAG: hypothetical protein IPN16_14620 [Gemmatimonadetes bacterium]|nr:hypothetical protein [Gemmatimonadota bacterium]
MRASILASLMTTVALVTVTSVTSAQATDTTRAKCKEGSTCDKVEDRRDRRENVRDRARERGRSP